MYVNGKMGLVETIPGMQVGGRGENDGESDVNNDIV
jgi:hypothetical protein